MRKKSILRLFLLIVFSISLYSCVHDEMASSTDPSSKEYTNKSLWKEDEKYIKNVMKVYDEHEADIKKIGGTPYWDYASTMETYDESYVAIPIVDGDKVVSVLQVPRDGSTIHFYYTNFRNQIDFFQKLIFSKYKKALPSETSSPTSKLTVCTTQFFSVWMPNDESNADPSSGAGHWETFSFIKCVQNMDHCVGVVNAQGQCETGGGGGGYPYPGGGNEPQEPEEPKDPCAKTKSNLANPQVSKKINDLKTKATGSVENAYKFKADGTPSNLIVGSAHSVNFGDKTGYQGGYHNHTTGTPMFSPADIEQLLQFALAQGNYGDTSGAYVGMVAPNGMHYVIQFNGNYQDALVTFSQYDLDNFNIDYRILKSDLVEPILNGTTYANSDGSINNVGVEKLFFETLKNMGLTGKVNLQRIESDGTVKTIGLNSSGQPIPIPCS